MVSWYIMNSTDILLCLRLYGCLKYIFAIHLIVFITQKDLYIFSLEACQLSLISKSTLDSPVMDWNIF